MIEPYTVACFQTNINVIMRVEDKEEIISRNLDRAIQLARYGGTRGGGKLGVFPEFFLQGICDDVRDRTIAEFQKVCVQIPGKETDILGKVARETNQYLAGACFEYDPEWPDRWFNTGWIISPEGKVILKHRKLVDLPVGVMTNTSPGDIYTEYVRKYGPEELFKVVDTPIGKLGLMICGEVNLPEIARCLAFNGAEIILHPTVEYHGSHRAGWQAARRARAYENQVYLIATNCGAILGSPYPEFQSDGHSEIVDYEGRTLAMTNSGGEAVITCQIDVNTVRYRKNRPGFNWVAMCRSDLFADEYRRAKAFPNDFWLENPVQDRREGVKATQAVVSRFLERGTWKKWE